jgi:glycosyltransferase involved in cell wall biosynthesis
MRVLVVFDNHYPEGMAMSNRLHLYAKGIVELGGKIRILAGKNKKKSNGIQSYEGVEYYTLNNSFFRSLPSVLSRLGFLFEKLNLFAHLVRNRKEYDIIWAIGYAWFPLFIFSLISKLFGKKLIIELNELPHSIVASRLQSDFTNDIKRWLLFTIAYPGIDGFIVISETLKNLATEKKSKNAKLIKIPIIMDSGRFKSEENNIETRFKNRFVFHAGTLTEEKDGIIQVFEAIARVIKEKDPQLKFVLSNKITLPAVIHKIDSIIEKYGIKVNVVFHNHLSKEQMDENLRTCTLVIINKPDNKRNSYNFATKLGEYMSYGIPIISTPVGEAAKYFEDRKNAHVVNSTDVDALVQRIGEILDNPIDAVELGNMGRKTATENFDFRLYSKDLLNFFSSLK